MRSRGLAINSPDQTHGLQHYRGGATVSAFQVACTPLCGCKATPPVQDAGIDFAREYELAKGLAGEEA